MLTYGSVCSGIEAASVAWHPLGWRAAFLSEIEPFPRAVLKHHYPDVPLHGDFTTIEAGQYDAIDLLVGGTPCQSFSVAGLRGGLADDRGNLALEYLRLAQRLRPKWMVWENVPGVLSSNGGRDFGSILGGMGELGYGFAYRVLDAQFVRINGFGRAVPQRRRRVFVVGHLGDWRRAAAVLFERESLCGNPPPRREAGKGSAPTLSARTKGGGGLGTDFDLDGGLISDISHPLLAKGNDSFDDSLQTYVATRDTAATLTRGAESAGKGGYAGRRQEDDDNLVARCDTARQTRIDWETETFVASVSPTLRAGGNATGGDRPVGTDVDTSETLIATCGTMPAAGGTDRKHGHGWGQQEWETGYCVPVLANGNEGANGAGVGRDQDPAFTLQVGVQQGVWNGWRVRRLTPTECLRLQGFPDDYLDVTFRGKPAADGPKYKATGNSMAVNCMRWIGTRIQMVEDMAERRVNRDRGGLLDLMERA